MLSDFIKKTLTPKLPKAIIAQLIESTIKKLNLVSREEFLLQSQVLLKTRKKLEALEKEVDSLLKNTEKNK